MHTKPKLSSNTLTYLAGIGGSGPLPQEAEQLSRHSKGYSPPPTHYGLWNNIKKWLKVTPGQR